MLKDFEAIRNSKMNLNEVYFWTDTVLDWKKLLKQDKYKQRIIEEWQKLIVKRKIAIYAFVLMPNHLHVVWELLEKNGKEMPHASFNKATGHEIIKDLKENHPAVLNHFEVNENERKYRIWQRDPPFPRHVAHRPKYMISLILLKLPTGLSVPKGHLNLAKKMQDFVRSDTTNAFLATTLFHLYNNLLRCCIYILLVPKPNRISQDFHVNNLTLSSACGSRAEIYDLLITKTQIFSKFISIY